MPRLNARDDNSCGLDIRMILLCSTIHRGMFLTNSGVAYVIARPIFGKQEC